MNLKSISISNFRNIDDLQLKFNKNLNLFIGNNGQGKSNILEALSLVLRGQSFRQHGISDLVRYGEASAALNSILEKDQLEHKIQLKIVNLKKNFSKNGKSTSAAHLAKNFSCILFSPESLNAIKSSSQIRRSLIDDLVAHTQPSSLENQKKYRKLIRSRNRVLKDYQQQKASRSDTIALLKSMEPMYLESSQQIAWSRTQALQEIREPIQQAISHLNEKNVDISLDYVVSGKNALNWSKQQLLDAHCQRRSELWQAELASGVTLVGPHKHDITFNWNGNDSRYSCSQGQQRALILAFKMAQIGYHRRIQNESLILLLDDVLSELDAVRREKLQEYLYDLDSQIFLTSTDTNLPERLLSSDCELMEVSGGRVFSK